MASKWCQKTRKRVPKVPPDLVKMLQMCYACCVFWNIGNGARVFEEILHEKTCFFVTKNKNICTKINTFVVQKCMKNDAKMCAKSKFWVFQKACIFAIQVAKFVCLGVILMAKWWKKQRNLQQKSTKIMPKNHDFVPKMVLKTHPNSWNLLEKRSKKMTTGTGFYQNMPKVLYMLRFLRCPWSVPWWLLGSFLMPFWEHFGVILVPKWLQNAPKMAPQWHPNGAKKASSGMYFGDLFEHSWRPKSCKCVIQVTKNEGPHFGGGFCFGFCAMFFEFDHCFLCFLTGKFLNLWAKVLFFYDHFQNHSKNTK